MCLALGIEHPDELRTRLTGPQIVSWWRYYQAEPWGEERADMRQEIGRQRATATEPHEMPSWCYPYRSLVNENAEESPAEFNARMRQKFEEIERQRAGAQ